MKKILLAIIFITVLCNVLHAQKNIDTPNLSFEDGNFSNWERYTGCFYYLPSAGTYQYEPWTRITTNDSRFIIGSNNNDPLVACDLKNSPLDKNAARIGEPLKREFNGTQYNGAAAERMIYRFKVTPNTTLLSYKLAAVLRTPTGDGHGGEQQPLFMMNIKVKDVQGNEIYLTCSDYSTIADFANPKLLRNKTKAQCPSSTAPTPEDYTYQQWYSGNIDFSSHVGDSVIIILTNRDCLFNYGGTSGIKGGNHESYGYFWAETRKLELSSFSCEDDDAKISAPQGFSLYEWSRSDNFPVTVPDPVNYPNVAKIEKTLNFKDIIYSCKMTDTNAGCGNTITLNTKIVPVVITPGFTFNAVDAGKIQFTDTSKISGDTIKSYFWEFGDGNTDNARNPIHTYTEFKPFTVKLSVTSSAGCSKSYTHTVVPTKELIADIFPPANLQYNGQTKDFTATTNITGLQMNIDYFIRYVSKPGTPYYNSYTAPSEAGDYNATFELSYQSLLKYFMNIIPSKDFSITKAPVTVTINSISKTYGDKISLQREGFSSSMNPLYAGDKIYELNVKCDGVADTASVKVYPVKADSAIGLGVRNYAITFVEGTLTVNPKTLIIKAIDNTKTYGDLIVATGREFSITPGSLVGKDSVKTVSLSCAGFPANAPVGTDTIKIAAANGYRLSNYTISYRNAVLETTKKKLTISALSRTKVYGMPYTLGKADYSVDKLLFVGSDSITNLGVISGATPFNAPVNDYSISLQSPVGPGLSNYDIKLVSNTFSVTPKPVTITANDASKEYGDALSFTGQEYSLNTPMVAGDTILAVTLKSTGVYQTASIGNYDILVSQAYGNGTLNYNFSYVTGKLNVIKKTLTATITPPANLNYNATAKEFTATVSVSNLVMNSDYFIRYTNRPGTDTYNSTTAPTAAGNYTATFELSAATLVNYQINNAPTQDFSIAKVPVIITVENGTKTYGDTYTLSGTQFKSNLQPLYGIDKISSLDLLCSGLADTASVGTYPITVSKINGNGLENYTITVQEGILTVNKKNLTIKANNQAKTYGDEIIALGNEFYVDAKQLVGNDAVNSVTLTCNEFGRTATVGNYPIKPSAASGKGLTNYQISYTDGILQISRKQLTLTALPQTKSYGTVFSFAGNEFTKSTSMVGNDTITFAQISSPASATKASVGSYAISLSSLTGTGLSNYDITLTGNTFTITAVNVVVTANILTKEFGTQLSFNGNEFSTDIPLVTGDSITFVLLRSSGTQAMAPVGEYEIDASQAYGPGSLNYNFSYVTGKLNVIKKTLTATITPPSNLNYNATAKEFTATVSVSNLVMNSHYFIRYTNRPGTATYNSITAPTAAGDYTATFELSAAILSNYQIDNPPTQDFTIAKVPVIITVENGTKTYGDTYTLSGTQFKSNLQPLYGIDKISSLDLLCNGLADTASVGTYPITVSKINGNGLENYTITVQEGILTVNKKNLTIKANNQAKTYGDEIIALGNEFYVDAKQLVGNDAVNSITLTCNEFGRTATVGNYPIKPSAASGKGLTNYQISYTDGILQISRKQLTLTALPQTKSYGTVFSFAGNEYTKSASMVGNDTITFAQISSPAAARKASVGSYAISLSSLTGTGLSNYDITLTGNTFTITAVDVIITAKNQTKQFGTLLNFNGNEFSTDIPLVTGDSITFVLLRSSGTQAMAPVGEYEIEASMADGPGSRNYNFSYVNGKLTVVKQKLEATLTPPASLVYNALPKDFTATTNISGLSIGNDFYIKYSNQPGTADYDSYIAPTAAGSYRASFELNSVTALRYYMDNAVYADFTITKAPIILTVDNVSKTYGETVSIPGTNYKSNLQPLYGNDKINYLDIYSAGTPDTASVGTYPIKATQIYGSGIENYSITYVDGMLTVNRKALAIKANNLMKTYGEVYQPTGKEFAIDPKAMVDKDSVNTVILNSNGFDATTPVGIYAIKAASASGHRLNNYLISYTDGTLQIIKKDLTITPLKQTKVYGTGFNFSGNEYALNPSTLVGTDKITSITMSSPATPAKAAVNEYRISAGNVAGQGLSNYNITLADSTFSVTPKNLTIRIDSLSKFYGDQLSFSGKEFKAEGLIATDTISYIVLQSEGTVPSAIVGNYPIKAAQIFGISGSNYTITTIDGLLRVRKKQLTALLKAPTYLGYNSQSKDFSATININGLVQNRDYELQYLSIPDTTVWNSTVAPSAAGNYKVSFRLTGLSPERYYMDTIPYKYFTIAKAPLTVTADNATKTYGEELTLLKTAFKTDMKPLFGSDGIYQVEFECKGLSDTALVGSYAIVPKMAVGDGISNYDIRYVAGTLSVKQKTLEIKAINSTKTYGTTITPNGTEFYVNPNDLIGNDAVTTVSAASDGYPANAIVGNYTTKISGAKGKGLSNYQISYSDASLQVVKRKITVTANTQTKTYGTEFSFKGNEYKTDISQFVGNDAISSIYFSSAACAKRASVGEHIIYINSISGNGLENYDITSVNNVFTISPMNVTITANNASKAYGSLLTFKGNEFKTDKTLVEGDTISFVVLQSDGCDVSAEVGTYDIRVSQANGGTSMNYTFSYRNGTLAVGKRTLIPALHAPDYLGYDSKAKAYTATMNISGMIQNTDYFIHYTNGSNTAAYDSYLPPSAAGNYVATFELSSSSLSRYNMGTAPSESFSITKAPLKITADDATKVYGTTLNLRSDAYTTDMKPLYGSDKVFSIQFSCTGVADTASVGTYAIMPVNASGNGLENYAISYSAGTLTINKKALVIKALDASKTYGEVIAADGKQFSIDAGLLVGNDAVNTATMTSEALPASAAVGLYPVKLSNAQGKRLNNYLISYVDANIQVLKRALTVKAKDIKKEYGVNYLFRGDEFEIADGKLMNTDKVNSVKLNSIGAQEQASVGEYVVSVTDVSGYRIENYDIKLQSNIFEVTPIPLTVTAKSMTKEYGDMLSFTGNEFTLDRSMVNNDTISYVVLKSAGSTSNASIGQYDIVASQAVGKGSLNYTIAYRSGKLNVTRKVLHVVAASFQKEYGEIDPVLSFTVTDDNGVEYLPSLFTGKVTRTAGETPGTYTITQGSLNIGNSYDYTFTAGEMVIKKAMPSIDPGYTNEGGQFILSDLIGTKNGVTPTGKVTISIASAGLTTSATLVNGEAKCAVSGLPNYQTQAEIHYEGDANYLPVSKTITIYAINYYTNGGTLVAPIKNFDGNESVKLETPSREQNHRFEGWYESEDFSGDVVRRIPLGTYRDVNLYAKWASTYEDLSIVVLFNQVLAVANPLNRDFLAKSTYKWYKDGVQLSSSKQYYGFDNYVPTGKYKVEIYYLNEPVITLELNHTATIPQSKVYPNPVRKAAALNVSTELAKSNDAIIEVFNAIGMKVGSIRSERQPDGFILKGFEASGVYFVRLIQNGKLVETHKVIVEN